MEHEGDDDTNCNWCVRYRYQRISKGSRRLGNKRTSGDHQDYSISKISQNTEKSPGDVRRFAVTQTPMEDHWLKLVWKTLKGLIKMIIREIQIDPPILARWPDIAIINKKKENLLVYGLCHSCRPLSKKIKENEKRDNTKILLENKKTWELKGNNDTNCKWCAQNNPQMICKGTGRLENKRTSWEHLHYSIINISQNTERSPGDLRRFAVTQTAVKNHQQTLRWKTPKGIIIIRIIIIMIIMIINK